jgi:pseudo-rSAM protein
MKAETDYWFTIEPYVYVNIVNESVLLYNTLDGVTVESDRAKVIALLSEVFKEENCGVVLLKDEQYKQKDINAFISELRKTYMGDIIDVALSKGKPVQLFPYFNFSHKRDKKSNFSPSTINVV